MSLFKRGNGTREYDQNFGNVTPPGNRPIESRLTKVLRQPDGFRGEQMVDINYGGIQECNPDLVKVVMEVDHGWIKAQTEKGSAAEADAKLKSDRAISADKEAKALVDCCPRDEQMSPVFSTRIPKRETRVPTELMLLSNSIIAHASSDKRVKQKLEDCLLAQQAGHDYFSTWTKQSPNEVQQGVEMNYSKAIGVDPKPVQRVFLGGTCNGSLWRDVFIKEVNKDDVLRERLSLFNPVVEDWTPECQANEEREKREADILFFGITTEQTGFYSIAEFADAVHTFPEKKIVVVFMNHDGDFTPAQEKSNAAIINLLARNKNFCGSTGYETMAEVAETMHMVFNLLKPTEPK